MSSRLGQLLNNIPPASLAILSLLAAVYGLQVLFDLHDDTIRQFTLCPANVVLKGELWRLPTSVVLHGSILHLAMNFMSGMGLCDRLERTLGTVALIQTTMVSAFATSLIHVGIASVAHFVFGYHSWFRQHSLGFSGILFHYAVLEASLESINNNNNINGHRQSTRSVFGLISVPVIWYPWALLIVLQLFMPNLSFLGHLSGILVGTFQVQANLFYYHSVWMEELLAGWRNFVPTNFSITPSNNTRSSVREASASLCLYIGFVLEAIMVILWGRRATVDSSNSILSEDDEEWIGLPISADIDDTIESQVV